MTLIRSDSKGSTSASMSASGSRSTRSAGITAAGTSTRAYSHVGSWSNPVQNLISAPLEEGVVPAFLTALYSFIEPRSLPPAKHVHVLLYLARQPGQPYLHAQASPLALLYRLSALHTSRNVANLLPLPGNPFRASDPKESIGEWDARGQIELETRRVIRACEADGVFALLWENRIIAPVKAVKPRTRRTRRKRGEESDEEQEEVEKPVRVVDPDAWGLVEWLVDLWKRDREAYRVGHPGQPAISPLFLEQLPRGAKDLQLDDLTCPLAILRSLAILPAYGPVSSIRHSLLQTLLDLILASVQGPSPPFHPDSLALALIPLFREVPLEFLSEVFTATSSSSYADTAAHLLTIYLEDLGGTRADRASIRRLVARGTPLSEAMRRLDLDVAEHDLDSDAQSRWGPLKPPSPGYFVCDLLPLSPASQNDTEVAERMAAAKSCLMSLMPDLCPLDDALWQWVDELDHDSWIEGLKRCMGPEAVDDTVAFVMDYVGCRAGDEVGHVDGDDVMDGRSQASRSRLGSGAVCAAQQEDDGQKDKVQSAPGRDELPEQEVYGTPMEGRTPVDDAPFVSTGPLPVRSQGDGSSSAEDRAMGAGGDEVEQDEPGSLEEILAPRSHRVIPLDRTSKSPREEKCEVLILP